MKTARIELKVEPELKQKAKKAAKKADRSLNQYIELGLKEKIQKDESAEAQEADEWENS